jgi:hypothetical protein
VSWAKPGSQPSTLAPRPSPHPLGHFLFPLTASRAEPNTACERPRLSPLCLSLTPRAHASGSSSFSSCQVGAFQNHHRPNPPPNLLLPYLEPPQGYISRVPCTATSILPSRSCYGARECGHLECEP